MDDKSFVYTVTVAKDTVTIRLSQVPAVRGPTPWTKKTRQVADNIAATLIDNPSADESDDLSSIRTYR